MTWTYDPATRSDRNRVRERVGDTDASSQMVSDEVIDEILAEAGGMARAASIVARQMRARLVRLPDRQIEGVSVTRARLEAIEQLIASLDAESGYGTVYATMSAGMQSRAADLAAIDDPDYDPVAAGWQTERVR